MNSLTTRPVPTVVSRVRSAPRTPCFVKFALHRSLPPPHGAPLKKRPRLAAPLNRQNAREHPPPPLGGVEQEVSL